MTSNLCYVCDGSTHRRGRTCWNCGGIGKIRNDAPLRPHKKRPPARRLRPQHRPQLHARHFLIIANFTTFAAARRAMGRHGGLIITDAPEIIPINDPLGAAAASGLVKKIARTIDSADAAKVVRERFGL